MEKTCNTCANSIYCPTWGEYKCQVHLRRNVYEPGEANDCNEYKKRTDEEEPKCHCDDCESQAGENIE